MFIGSERGYRNAQTVRLNQAHMLGEETKESAFNSQPSDCHQRRMARSRIVLENHVFENTTGTRKVGGVKTGVLDLALARLLQLLYHFFGPKWPVRPQEESRGHNRGGCYPEPGNPLSRSAELTPASTEDDGRLRRVTRLEGGIAQDMNPSIAGIGRTGLKQLQICGCRDRS